MATRSISSVMSQQITRYFFTRNFALLWFGQFISKIGDSVFDVTVVLWITTTIAQNRSWASLAVSGVFLSIALPSFFISPVAGVFVDRWNKRRVMLTMDLARAVLITLLFVVSILPLQTMLGNDTGGWWQLAAIYLTIVLASACSQFFSPSEVVLIKSVVPDEHIAQASARNQLTVSLSLIIGAPVAALLFFSLGIWFALVVDALSFFLSFLCILIIRTAREEQETVAEHTLSGFLSDFRAGMEFFFRNRILRSILVCLVLIVLGSTASNVLSIFFIEQNLHAPASFYGTYTAVAGIGAITSSLLAGTLVKKLGMLRALWLTPLFFGCVMLIYARLTNIYPALVLQFVLTMPGILFNVAIIPVVFRVTPQEFLGRIASTFTPIVTLASILGSLSAGYLAGTVLNQFHATLFGMQFGPIDTIFVGTALLALLAGLAMFLGVRHTDVDAQQKAEENVASSGEFPLTGNDEEVLEA